METNFDKVSMKLSEFWQRVAELEKREAILFCCSLASGEN